ISDVSQLEGNAGTTPFVFNVTLSAPSASIVTVKYATIDNTALSHGKNADYSKVQGTLSFAPGEISQTVIVLVNGDTIVEPDETFFVALTKPTSAVLARDQGIGTVQNDDGAAFQASGQAIAMSARSLAPTSFGAPLPEHDAGGSTTPI